MNSNRTKLLLLGAVLAVVLVTTITTQEAFAHSSRTESFNMHGTNHEIRVVLGHTNEPTYGFQTGIHDGKHNLEVTISDKPTTLRLSGANLKADMYYFKNIKNFNKAATLNDADDVIKGVTIGSVFGDPGRYIIRELQEPGIYGYRIYGMINYFGVKQVPIDATVFCTSPEGSTTKFNTSGWSRSFGCTDDINSIKFPKKSKRD